MAFVVADRVQETGTVATGTGSVNLAGAVNAFQTFSNGIGNGNSTYYTIVDPTAYLWEVGIGTYTTSGNTLSRTTVLSNSSGNTSLISFSTSDTLTVFCTYPSEKAVYGSGTTLVAPSGTILPTANGGTNLSSFTSGGAVYATSTTALTTGTLPAGSGGTGVTASSGANSVVLRDSNQNVFANNFIPNTTTTTASATPINLTVSSAQYQVVNGTVTSQTFNLPDATTLTVGDTFYFNNNITYSSVQINAHDGTTSLLALQAGGAAHLILLTNSTTNGTWDIHSYVPSSASWGTATLNFNSSSSISGSVSWQGNAVGAAYGGTGLTTLTANNVILGNGTSAVQFVAPGTSGNILTSNGTTWTSAASTAATTDQAYFLSFMMG